VIRVLLALALFAACTPVVPVYMLENTDSTTARDIVSEGFSYLEVGVDFVSKERNASITIEFIEPQQYNCGHMDRVGPCKAHVTACAGPIYVGHEAGHAFRLHHVRELHEPITNNLMDPVAPLAHPEVTDKQLRRAARAANALEACR
jgi:hypothetical protein